MHFSHLFVPLPTVLHKNYINMENVYVIGLELGTDSARALLVNARTGEEVDTEVVSYPRWMEGRYTVDSDAQFRHHPLDYIEAVERSVGTVVRRHPDMVEGIVSISLDTTASTPCLVDRECTPLALKPEYRENPDAMFVVWKDHTGQAEADEINALLSRQPVNYALHTGNSYSAENFWSKVLHVLRHSPELQREAYSAIEICDYIPALLTGCRDASAVRIGHCGAASKAMWAEEWGGYPPAEFFEQLDPVLLPILAHLPRTTYSCEKSAGRLTPEWAGRLGLRAGIVIGVGNVDSHSGGVGGGIEYGTMVMNLGTSACFMSVMPPKEMGDTIVEGIFSQVEGSILSHMVGFESGLSAFGDVFAWFRKLMMWPLENIAGQCGFVSEQVRQKLMEEAENRMLDDIAHEAERLEVTMDTPLATDWLNGRRAPYSNSALTATVSGLSLSTTVAEIYYSLVEATAFATKCCIDHNSRFGVVTRRLVAIGGIARKSPFVVQMLSDVMNMPIEVPDCPQAGTLGAAIHAAVVAGVYPSVGEAQRVLCKPVCQTYHPNAHRHVLLQHRYARYIALGKFTESSEFRSKEQC